MRKREIEMEKKRTAGPLSKGGRPRVEIDYEKIDSLAGIFCTSDEIVAFLGVCHDTIDQNIKRQFGIGFSDYIKQKQQGTGKPSLRRMQYLAAKNGSVAMLIWLGKQYLGQKDQIVEIVQDTEPREITFKIID